MPLRRHGQFGKVGKTITWYHAMMVDTAASRKQKQDLNQLASFPFPCVCVCARARARVRVCVCVYKSIIAWLVIAWQAHNCLSCYIRASRTYVWFYRMFLKCPWNPSHCQTGSIGEHSMVAGMRVSTVIHFRLQHIKCVLSA